MKLLNTLSYTFLAGLLMLVAQNSWAVTDTEFAGMLKANETKLSSIEGTLSRIKSQKLVKLGDEGMDQSMYAYAESMKSAFDLASSEALKAAKSNGREGNVGLVGAFEKMAKVHEQRTALLEGKLKAIDSGVKAGDILLDKSLLQRMTPSERSEFKGTLSPGAIRNYERLSPGLLNLRVGPTSSLMPDVLALGVAPVAEDNSCFNTSLSAIGDFFLSPAEAAIAAPCVGVCWSRNWSACTACVVAAGPAAINAWNAFVGQWNGCCGCKWYKPWCCACKAAAVAKLVAKLA
ncbi:MAG: hypothetical protein PHE17_18335 [Thiothrix sp.]|uniref:hypothetical protein n=1 Tax=Thiothrix sp. TaxID=1032 RepID=UPI002605D7C5|nr:hypothetical protein [Thiothrix sp.]MDD5394981.1 hypothetical protein [Thiothrix sp.]